MEWRGGNREPRGRVPPITPLRETTPYVFLAARVHTGMSYQDLADSPRRANRAKLPTPQEDIDRLRADLGTPRDAQGRIFPGHLPRVPGLDRYGERRPARDAGGHFHDFVSLGRHGPAVPAGDVTGQGNDAGIPRSELRAPSRGLASLGPSGSGRMVRELNRAAWPARGWSYRVSSIALVLVCGVSTPLP